MSKVSTVVELVAAIIRAHWLFHWPLAENDW